MDQVPDVGVIVGRFQVHELTAGHRKLFDYVTGRHDKVLVLVGVSPLWVTQRNPLDFETRKSMLLNAYPKITVQYIKDVGNHQRWSKKLDEIIRDFCTPAQTAMLYGSRDSFIAQYQGAYATEAIEPEAYWSGSAARRLIGSRSTKASADFAAGVIWATLSRHPVAYPTVDIALFGGNYSTLLMGRKPNEQLLRFIGGFATPDSDRFEDDAIREVREEAGVAIYEPVYIGSFHIDDWRYRGERDQIKTLLFTAEIIPGSRPEPGDDIEEVRFVPISVDAGEIVPSHRPLLTAVQEWAEVQRRRVMRDSGAE
jgi:bifunctional NMN adenylyltransferase/nudix hydrolase